MIELLHHVSLFTFTAMTSKEMAPDDAEAANAAATTKKKFPTPKFVAIIYSRNAVTADVEVASDRGVGGAWKAHLAQNTGVVTTAATSDVGSGSGSTSTKKNKKVRVKMQSLLIKMINRLVREEVIPAEAVSVVAGSGYISMRILVAPAAVPILMLRCERIGIGNVAGTVHVCPLETSLVPPATKKEIDMFVVSSANNREVVEQRKAAADAKTTASAGDKSGVTLTTSREEEEAVSVSESDDMEDDDNVSTGVSIPAIPFLSAERKKTLQDAIVEARREWRNTSSRVRVLQIIEEVSAGAKFTFDYCLFVFCASFIAAVGLATDSGPTVIASMLVSPIMGPVMGMTFGTTVRSKKLVGTSLRNEIISLMMCLVVGAVVCAITVSFGSPASRDWPTSQMASRGDVTGLVSGIFVAIPSGMAVALSTLGKNSGGMVGVAISLSLLPPAVNASMCWTYELLLLSKTFNRNEGDTADYWFMGGVSFSLTLINIACIWVAGTFTFFLKEVVPLKKANAFWKQDIQEYRLNGAEKANIAVINDGIEAALELQNDQPDLHKKGNDDLCGIQIAVERRQGLANNAVEDAFYLDNNALKSDDIVAGGAIDLDEAQLQEAANDTAMARDLLNKANKYGRLEDAGRALFDNELLSKSNLADDGDAFLQTDIGIQHGTVAEELLLREL